MKLPRTEIVKYLVKTNTWVSTKQIAADLGVSVRTIRSYVAELNVNYPNIINSSNKGYQVNKAVAGFVINNNEPNRLPQSQDERIRYITQKLMTNYDNVKQLALEDLEDELFVSSTTIVNDLKIIRRQLADRDLKLIREDNLIYVRGSEKNKRSVVSGLLYEEADGGFISNKRIQTFFPDYDVDFIYKVVKNELNQAHLFYNDYAFSSLILHIVISLDRVKHQLTYASKTPQKYPSEYQVAKTIISVLSEHFDAVFPEQEAYEMALLLQSRTSELSYTQTDTEQLIKELGQDSYDLTKQLIDEVSNIYYVDLSEEDFIAKFTLHIHNLLVRYNEQYPIHNPLTQTIRNQYPMIYEIALYMASRIHELRNISLNSDEVSYIALHIGGELESKQAIESKLTCVLFSPKYYNQNLMIVDRLNHEFPALVVNGITSIEHDLKNEKDIDFILSTVPLSSTFAYPTMQISPFVSVDDIQKINDLINQLLAEKNSRQFQQWIEEFITRDLFAINKNFANRDETLDSIVKKLEKKDYVDKSFRDQIQQRETLNSTAFGNIAIPHTLKMTAKKTGIYVLLSKTPIIWDDKRVNLVLLLAINQADSNAFRRLYENLTSILGNANNVIQLLDSADYTEFVQSISHMAYTKGTFQS